MLFYMMSSHCNSLHLQYLFHFYSQANITHFFFLTAHRLLDTCAEQMESELSLTASFIPDGLNYFITINDTPSASCAALPDVQRPQSHSLLWRLVTSRPLKDVPSVQRLDDTSTAQHLSTSLSNHGERRTKTRETSQCISKDKLSEAFWTWRISSPPTGVSSLIVLRKRQLFALTFKVFSMFLSKITCPFFKWEWVGNKGEI